MEAYCARRAPKRALIWRNRCAIVYVTTLEFYGVLFISKLAERTICLLNRLLSDCHHLLQCNADKEHPIFHQMHSRRGRTRGIMATR